MLKRWSRCNVNLLELNEQQQFRQNSVDKCVKMQAIKISHPHTQAHSAVSGDTPIGLLFPHWSRLQRGWNTQLHYSKGVYRFEKGWVEGGERACFSFKVRVESIGSMKQVSSVFHQLSLTDQICLEKNMSLTVKEISRKYEEWPSFCLSVCLCESAVSHTASITSHVTFFMVLVMIIIATLTGAGW